MMGDLLFSLPNLTFSFKLSSLIFTGLLFIVLINSNWPSFILFRTSDLFSRALLAECNDSGWIDNEFLLISSIF